MSISGRTKLILQIIFFIHILLYSAEIQLNSSQDDLKVKTVRSKKKTRRDNTRNNTKNVLIALHLNRHNNTANNIK